TFVEVLRTRGSSSLTHLTFLFFGMATNCTVSAMLITGAFATLTQLNGMLPYACHYLIPLTVTCYVLVGGMRSSLLTDYIHSTLRPHMQHLDLICSILTFLFTAYTTSDTIGSPGRMWELLREAAAKEVIESNAGGQYLTCKSEIGGVFGVINMLTGNARSPLVQFPPSYAVYHCVAAKFTITCASPPCPLVARPSGDATSSVLNFDKIDLASGSAPWTVDQPGFRPLASSS
ncbi:hypothetical protein JCM8547_004272, partial [Rhodosporidiobolus lusitaniae]